MNDVIIRAEGLTKDYGKITAIDDLSVSICGDRIIGLVGRNGAGKTTLMKMIAGRLDKTGGELEVFGSNPMDNLDVLQNIVYTHHDLEYDKKLRLSEILINYSVMFENFDSDFAMKLLYYFSLDPKRKFKTLSQGMVSIFNYICGLSCRTPLVLLDEPVLGMDVTVRKAAYEVLLREFTEHPRTIIVSSHLLSEIEGILSDILLLDEGKLLLYKNVDDFRQSAYRVEGEQSAIDVFINGKNIIYKKTGLTAESVVFEPLSESTLAEAKKRNLVVTAVRPEDLYVYLTKENKEGELECLWQKTN